MTTATKKPTRQEYEGITFKAPSRRDYEKTIVEKAPTPVPQTAIPSPDIYGPFDVWAAPPDSQIWKSPGARFTKGFGAGWVKQTQIPTLLGKKLPAPATRAEKIGEGAGRMLEAVTELIGVGAALRGLGILPKVLPKGATVLEKALHTGVVFGTQQFTEEARKATSEAIYDEPFGSRGGMAVLESFTLGAILSLAGSGVGKVWNKLKPTEQLRALKTLGLKRGATLQEINRAARREAFKYHPDKVKGMRAQFDKVINARDALRRAKSGDVIIAHAKQNFQRQLVERIGVSPKVAKNAVQRLEAGESIEKVDQMLSQAKFGIKPLDVAIKPPRKPVAPLTKPKVPRVAEYEAKQVAKAEPEKPLTKELLRSIKSKMKADPKISEMVRGEPGFAGGGPVPYENLPTDLREWLGRNELVEAYKEHPLQFSELMRDTEAIKPEEQYPGDKYKGKAWRSEPYGKYIKSEFGEETRTLEDIITHEYYELGNEDVAEEAYRVLDELGLKSSEIPANRILWVADTKEFADGFGEAAEEITIPKNSTILSTDKEGGYLVLLPEKYSDKLLPKPTPKPAVEKVVAPKAEPTVEKKPWEMTREEFVEQAAAKHKGKLDEPTLEIYKEQARKHHWKAVHDAVAAVKQGRIPAEQRQIPREVLEEYKSEPWAREALKEAPKAEPTVEKQPWEIKQREFLRSRYPTEEKYQEVAKTEKSPHVIHHPFVRLKAQHQLAVRDAFDEGKPVPREVLEEYKSEPWAQEALKEAPAEKVEESFMEMNRRIWAERQAEEKLPELVKSAISRKRRGDPKWTWDWERASSEERKVVDNWLVNSGHPLAMEVGTPENRFKRLVEEYAEKVVAPKKVEGKNVTDEKLSELRGAVGRTSERYGITQARASKSLSKTEQNMLARLPNELDLGPWSHVLLYSPELKGFSKPEHSAVIKLIDRGALQLFREDRPVSKKYSSGFTYVLRKPAQPPAQVKPKGKPGFVDVRPLLKAHKTFMDIVEPSKAVEMKLGKEPYAAVIKGIHQKDVGRIEFNEAQIEGQDKSIQQLGEWFNKFSEKDLKYFMLSRGEPTTENARLIQRSAREKLHKDLRKSSLFNAVQRIADSNYKYLQNMVGDDIHRVEDYFYGIYKNPKKVDKLLDYWRTTKRFTKEKKLPTVADALDYDSTMELRNWNPVENLKAEYIAISHLEGMNWLRDELLRTGKGKFIDDMLEAPIEWDMVHDPIFKELRLQPDLAKLINNLIATNKITRIPIANTLREINNVARTIKFIGSAFHLLSVAKQSVADSGYLGFLYKPTALRGFTGGFRKNDPIFKTTAYKDYIKHGGGHRYSVESEARRAFTGAVDQLNRNMGIAVKAGALPLKIPTGFVNWMFQSYIPKVKYSKFLDVVAEQEKKLNRKLTSPEKIDIIKEQQNFYGMMNERLFGRSGTVTSALRFYFMSPGYAEGNYRTMLKAATQWGGKAGFKANRSRSNIINSWLITAAAATAGTLAFTGKLPKKPETLDDVRDLFKIDTGKTDNKGRRIMIDLMTYDKDYWNVAFNILRLRPDVAVGKSWKRIGGMKAPTADIILDLAQMSMGRAIYDWKGDRVVDITDPFLLKAMKLTNHEVEKLVPISVSVFQQSKRRDIDTTIAAIETLMGFRPTKTEKDAREQKLISKMYSLRGQREELSWYIGQSTDPKRTVERYNKTVNDILKSPYVPKSMKDEWGPKLLVDYENVVTWKRFPAGKMTDIELRRAFDEHTLSVPYKRRGEPFRQIGEPKKGSERRVEELKAEAKKRGIELKRSPRKPPRG